MILQFSTDHQQSIHTANNNTLSTISNPTCCRHVPQPCFLLPGANSSTPKHECTFPSSIFNSDRLFSAWTSGYARLSPTATWFRHSGSFILAVSLPLWPVCWQWAKRFWEDWHVIPSPFDNCGLGYIITWHKVWCIAIGISFKICMIFLACRMRSVW